MQLIGIAMIYECEKMWILYLGQCKMIIIVVSVREAISICSYSIFYFRHSMWLIANNANSNYILWITIWTDLYTFDTGSLKATQDHSVPEVLRARSQYLWGRMHLKVFFFLLKISFSNSIFWSWFLLSLLTDISHLHTHPIQAVPAPSPLSLLLKKVKRQFFRKQEKHTHTHNRAF